MDPHARRFTWELLRTQREGRTLVLTTHYLDEAEILADRIAIMAHGTLRACGSARFLKMHFGIGHRLTATKKEMGSEGGIAATSSAGDHPATSSEAATSATSSALVQLARSHVPDAALLEERKRAIDVQLPNDAAGDDTARLTNLFQELETQLDRLGCTDFGVSTTSLEDVFLQVSQL